MARTREIVMRYLAGEADRLASSDRSQAEQCLNTLKRRFGYCDACAADTLEFLHHRL